jgi:hypothetical protein
MQVANETPTSPSEADGEISFNLDDLCLGSGAFFCHFYRCRTLFGRIPGMDFISIMKKIH